MAAQNLGNHVATIRQGIFSNYPGTEVDGDIVRGLKDKMSMCHLTAFVLLGNVSRKNYKKPMK
jgi:hypothetical protein